MRAGFAVVRGKARGKVVPWPAKGTGPGAAAAALIAPTSGTRAKPVASPSRPPLTSTLASGYRLTLSSEREPDLITLTAPDGRVCLSVALRPEGPVVQVQAQSLSVASDGVLRLACDRLEIQAPGGTSLRTGSLEQEIAGDLRTRAGGIIDSEAHAQRLHARRGDVALSANDDVTLDGERVRLNSPREATLVRPAAPPPAVVNAVVGRERAASRKRSTPRR